MTITEHLIPDTKEGRLELVHRIQNALTKKFQVYSGKDSLGECYDSIEEMWRKEGYFDDGEKAHVPAGEEITTKQCSSRQPDWYNKSHQFWDDEKNVPPTLDGMLGGFSQLTERDLNGSRKFLDEVLEARPLLKEAILLNPNSRSCECGAGIGRLTKGLFLPLGFNCDLVETSPRLLGAAPDYIGKEAIKCKFIRKGLQDFYPSAHSYDIVWLQWVIGYLNDWDLCNLLHRLGNALRPGGVIVIKDNTCNEEAFLSDRGDSDITRSYQYLKAIIRESGLKVVQSDCGEDMIQWQTDFPDDIWPVPMIALCVEE